MFDDVIWKAKKTKGQLCVLIPTRDKHHRAGVQTPPTGNSIIWKNGFPLSYRGAVTKPWGDFLHQFFAYDLLETMF